MVFICCNYSILTFGAQPRITMELAKGNQSGAREIFSMIILSATVLASLMGVFMFCASGFVSQLLGAAPDSAGYVPCMAYLKGLAHGAGKREAYYISLAVEEMGTNILKHGFKKDKGRHVMELRLIHKHHSFMLRIRDNSHIFDPIKKMAAISSIHDPSRYIGLRMVMKMASNVTYTSTLKLNNLVVEIDLPEKKETETADTQAQPTE